jgi:O-antigen/teichoic acid export membrane protein
MNLKFRAFKNVGSNWFGAVVSLLVGIFLSPFILHRLGDEAFGLWILIFSLTGYYGIFDFGIRSAIVKYVAEFEATEDLDQLTKIVNVSIFVYGCISLALLAVVGTGSLYVNSIFRIPAGFHHTARLLLLIVGSEVALSFPLSVFAGILEGLQRFYFVNLTQAVATLLRALLIVLALNHGMGLLTVAFVTVVFPLLSYVVYAWKVMSIIPLQFGTRFLGWAVFRQMNRYSFYSFISTIAYRLRYQTDAVIIGVMLSASAITYFSIGSKLLNYSFLLVAGVGQIFTPMSSQFSASGDHDRLKKLFVLGNRACALIVFPISAILIILGKPIIDVWVGSRYESSYVILLILLIPSVLSDIQGSSRQILYGMGRHQVLAVVNIGEGVVNIILSVIFIHYWGIVGDALGTAIPLTLTSLFFLPRHLCRLLKVSLRDFISHAYVLPLALCMPLVVTLLFLQRLFHPHNLLQLAAQATIGCLVYVGGAIWAFVSWEPMGLDLRLKCRQYMRQAFGR